MTSIDEEGRPAVRTTTVSVRVDRVEVTVEDRGPGRAYLLLHGGGGPRTMSAFAELLAERTRARVLLPTHPGFAGTPRPEGLDSTRDLAAAYVELIERLDLVDLVVIGNSFGGWLAAEMALLGSPRVRGVAIVDGVGAEVPGHAVADLRGLSAAGIAALSWHNPSRAPVVTAGEPAPSPDLPALLAYAGPRMVDPTLLGRLGGLDLPVHVMWGERPCRRRRLRARVRGGDTGSHVHPAAADGAPAAAGEPRGVPGRDR